MHKYINVLPLKVVFMKIHECQQSMLLPSPACKKDKR